MSPHWTSQGTGPWGMSGSWEDSQAESGAGPQAVATSDPGPPAATVEMDDFQPQPSPFGQQMLSFWVFLRLKPHVLASETLSPSDCWSKARFLDKFSRTFITSILKKAGGSSEMKAHTLPQAVTSSMLFSWEIDPGNPLSAMRQPKVWHGLYRFPSSIGESNHWVYKSWDLYPWLSS